MNCITCGFKINDIAYDSIRDSVEDNFDGYYNNDSETDFIYFECPDCKTNLTVEYDKETEILINISED